MGGGGEARTGRILENAVTIRLIFRNIYNLKSSLITILYNTISP